MYHSIKHLANRLVDWLDMSRPLDFLGPLALRLYLGPVFIYAGMNKLGGMDSVISWFGNAEWGLGLPFPAVLAWAATLTELLGGFLLLAGLGVRWICLPLMLTMIVAAVTVHWEYGWQAVHDLKSPWASANAGEAIERLAEAKQVLKDHANYSRLTEHGRLVSLNNGIEWAATYFIMLLALFFTGAGKWLSMDYWIDRYFRDHRGHQQ